MQDSISKGQGNSRYLKTVANFKALYPTYDDFADAFVAGTLPVDFNGKNNAGWQQIGTELSKENLMSDQSASLFNLSSSNVPDDIFDLIGRGLPIRNGGTGATTAKAGMYNLINPLSPWTNTASSAYFPVLFGTNVYKMSYDTLSSAIKYKVSLTLKPQEIGAATVEMGSYTGDGGTGSIYARQLTFSSEPKIIFIHGLTWGNNNGSYSTEIFPRYVIVDQLTTSYREFTHSNSSSANHIFFKMGASGTVSGGTLISFYGTKAADWNESGETYYYAAIL